MPRARPHLRCMHGADAASARSLPQAHRCTQGPRNAARAREVGALQPLSVGALQPPSVGALQSAGSRCCAPEPGRRHPALHAATMRLLKDVPIAVAATLTAAAAAAVMGPRRLCCPWLALALVRELLLAQRLGRVLRLAPALLFRAPAPRLVVRRLHTHHTSRPLHPTVRWLAPSRGALTCAAGHPEGT
jgi:hypothetical protein